MKKIFIAAICLLAMLICGCANESTPHDTLIIGVDDEFAPMTFRDENNNLVGFEVDLARETAKRMGVAIEFKKIDWNNKENELNAGNIDMIWNGMDITPERQEVMLFGKPYMDNRHIIAVAKNFNAEILSESDLAGKIVGAKAGTTSEFYIIGNDELRNSLKEFKTYHDDAAAFQALKDGKIDAVVCDEIVVRYEMIKNSGAFKALEITIGPVHEMGVGFRKSDTELRDRVQAAFDEIVKDGTAKKISEKWFQADLIKYRR